MRYRRLLHLACVSLVALSTAPAGAAGASSETERRPRIGLALSGGGARGAAHIGVFKVLEEHRIPVDYIAGTSMGALVGGLYATGMSPAELETLVSQMDWTGAFSDRIPREDRSFRHKRDDDLYLIKHRPGISGLELKFPPGLLDGHKIDLLLKKYTLPVAAVRDFDELNIPFRAVATDLVTGDTVVIGHGNLALAMRASMSIPAVFAPREIDGRLLVDGGTSCNLPIDVVRQMGAEVVIAVDISTPLLEREELRSVLNITNQISNFLTRRDTDRQVGTLTEKDVFIRPDLGDISTASFDRAGEAIPIGVSAAESVLGQLTPLSVSEQNYRVYRDGRVRRSMLPVINEVRIVNHSRLADGVIDALLGIETGKSLDVGQLEKNIGQLIGLELFESVYYDIIQESERTVLTVTVRENSWGPNYLQSGIAVFDDYEGPNFNVAVAYTRTAVNRLNGEWRTNFQLGQEPGVFTEFYQPLDKKLRYFVHLKASFIEQADNVFDTDGNKLSELGVTRYDFELAGGRELGRWGEIRAGVIRGAGKIKMQVGDPSVPDDDFNTGEVLLRFFVDELDSVNFPSSGGDFRILTTAALDDLGSDVDYEQAIVEGSLAYTVGPYTGLMGGMFATTNDSNAPYQGQFRLGGFTRISGLERNELKDQHAALLSGIFYRRLGDFSFLSLYGGLSLEYGNVFQEREEIDFDGGVAAGSVFLGVDTVIGPVFLAYGFAEGGRQNFYFILGQSFNYRRVGFANQ